MADKLSQLIDTEVELDAMLERTKKQAEALVESARTAAEERVRAFEADLDAQDAAVRERIAKERDEAIRVIQSEAKEQVDRLEGLPDETLDELARDLVAQLLGAEPGWQP